MEQLSFKILREAIFATFKFIFYEFPLSGSNRNWENAHKIHFERYQTEDAHMLEEVIKSMDIDQQFTMKEVAQRINDGHMFFVAKKGGEIIGHCWYFVNKARMEDFDATIYLRSNEVCAANAYIQTNFRGMNILNCMRAYVYDELKKNKYKRVLTFVVDWNKAAIRMHQKWGSVEIGVAKRINLLTLAYHYSNLESNKIIFHGGPFFLWKKLFHGKKAYELKEGRDEFC